MSTSKPLDGRRAVVTGAGSGIGEAIALAYAQAGAQLVLADLDAARADSVARRCRALGTQAETVIGDVGDEAAAHRIIDHCVQALGGIDILVNNASLPLGRFGRADEVAPTAVLLASDPGGNLYAGQTLGPNSGDVMQ
jgi:3-oxoacyl-[acyl-carrier protein] reductase